MLELSLDSIKNSKEAWAKINVGLPHFDIEKVSAETKNNPEWIHFGGGNIFRAFIADLQQKLLESGNAKSGIIVTDTFDDEIITKIYDGFDNLALRVLMNQNGDLQKDIVASVGEAVSANSSNADSWNRLKEIFVSSSLKMVSFTITEKGYALKGIDGKYNKAALSDIENGPAHPVHAMGIVTALLLERFKSGKMPIALVSMDNCSHNGEKLQSSVWQIADEWKNRGFAGQDFIDYLHDEKSITFPWSMIDKITPRPAPVIQKKLEDLGICNMSPITTTKGSFIAPFVNSEIPQYLIIEDRFPAGRPKFELLKDFGVYMTDRDTVNNTEKMKVTTCLNPLHTALAVYGCILGYKSIAEEMMCPELVNLIREIGYKEGMQVVVHPGILEPVDFINEVVQQRLPNPFIPDTPQRIATDTSQKVPIRYGETIKSFIAKGLPLESLKGISFAIAGWLRYLLAVDDNGNPMELSSDPMLDSLKKELSGIQFGKPETVDGALNGLLSNKIIFAQDLVQTPLAAMITGYLKELVAGPGAVRKTLSKYFA